MKAVRLLAKTRIPMLLLPSQQRSVPFSSSTAAEADTNPRSGNFFLDESQGSSAVYRRALRFQRPTTIGWQHGLSNSASFIGTVVQPLVALHTDTNGCRRARTVLSVSPSHRPRESFRISLDMKDELAEMCLKHLKVNDFIYVSGRLLTSTRADPNGSLILYYKVLVKELNYVTQVCHSTCQKYQEPHSVEGRAAALERRRNRLNLWQVFFRSPYEWWDNRNDKLLPGSPDFKHKDTGEALWLSPNDPPWIEKQLKLLDSEMGLGGRVGRRARVSKWEFDA